MWILYKCFIGCKTPSDCKNASADRAGNKKRNDFYCPSSTQIHISCSDI